MVAFMPINVIFDIFDSSLESIQSTDPSTKQQLPAITDFITDAHSPLVLAGGAS